MPHTTTKKERLKRPDTRPNGKVRKAMKAKIEAGKKIQDIRVTSVQKGDRKERIVPKGELRSLSKDEKYIRGLKKKLGQIHDLIVKRDAGEEMNDQQLQKIDSLSETLQKLEDIIGTAAEQT